MIRFKNICLENNEQCNPEEEDTDSDSNQLDDGTHSDADVIVCIPPSPFSPNRASPEPEAT